MASEDSNRSVADYFVVAGLPQKDPQLLDECSLEVNLKNGAYQDPITDIAVIIPSLGENVPDYYQLIDQTPGGQSADLNSGSFRAAEVFVCYRRSRDRAPLLDIGVLYDGKERVTPDSQIVEFTPNGHSANVNNTHNSSVYLTYRRATEVSPPNEKVVMDICVVVTTKGDTVPHGFKKIDKTLNKGMVGSDVYLCYKKSMNRPDLISYKPGLLTRLPLNNEPAYNLDENVALFCMPMGATLECWPSTSSRPAAAKSTFVLTTHNSSRNTYEKVYGTAITFYEEYDEALLTEEQKTKLNLSSGSKWSSTSDRKILANKCICLLSRWPFFEAFKSFLFFLHKRQLMGPFDVPLERFISHFLYNVPFPSPERPRILVQLSADEKIALFQPEELPLPRSGASFRHLLANLGPENCLMVLLLALTEQNILVHSFRPDVLTSVCEAVMQIIFPFAWQCPYIPLCPIGMSTYLASPMPVIVGLDSRFFDLYDQPEDVNAIDLDTNTITLAAGLKNFNTKTLQDAIEKIKGSAKPQTKSAPDSSAPETFQFSTKLLPKKPAKLLRNTLQLLMEKLANQVKMARELEAHNDETIDFVFKMKKPEMTLEMEIREAFLRFMVQILSGYSSCLVPIRNMPTVGATDVSNLFNQSDFIASRDKNYHKFYALLMQTQMFTKFIEERSFVSDTNTSLAFFDECVANCDNPERFLELDFPDSDRTVFIMPPDNSGLPADTEYRYEKFENLNPELFQDRVDDKSDKPSNTPVWATPVSNVLLRRPHEYKSDIKRRQKYVENPFHWAKYLVNATYSLWFIHMPSFMVSNKAVDDVRALKLAILILQRMRRLRLAPIEEICYQVLTQLCGVYHQPRIAMEVMNEMALMGMTPNAVTHGYYNKAVLESKWPEPQEPSKALKTWQHLSLVLEVVRRFRQCGREAQTVDSFARERMQNKLQQQKTLNGGSKSELDNVSRSSQDSSVSRQSSSNQNEPNKKVALLPTNRKISAPATLVTLDNCSEEFVTGTGNKDLKPTVVLDQSEVNGSNSDTPATGTKGIPRYDRGKFSNLLGTNSSQTPLKPVNRVLFSKPQSLSQSGSAVSSEDFLDSRESCGSEDGIEPLKSRSASVDSDDMGMMMGEPVTKENNQENKLPTVLESAGEEKSPNNNPKMNLNLLTPPESTAPMHKVGSSASIKLVGEQLEIGKDNDPLGALSNNPSPTTTKKSATLPTNSTLSPTSMQKSATACELLQGNNQKRPSLQENILGSPFSTSSKEMSRSSTMPLSGDSEGQNSKSGYFASLKSMVAIKSSGGGSKLSSLKATAAASTWMSPTSKKSLNEGYSSLKSAISNTASTLSKRVEELREPGMPSTPSRTSSGLTAASSNPNLTSVKDEDSLSTNSMTGVDGPGVSHRRPSEITEDSWSNLTGQIWDQLWNYSYDKLAMQQQTFNNPNNQNNQSSNQSMKGFAELFEELYERMPVDIARACAMELVMTSSSQCKNCSSILYDEEIIAGWTADDSNLNTKCPFCVKPMVPLLTIKINDFRTETSVSDETPAKPTENGDQIVSNKIDKSAVQVPYLSPLVLRKELESILEREGDACLSDAECVNEHPIIYWNLIWFFERIGVCSHLPGMCLKASSLNPHPESIPSSWSKADHRNVSIKIKWDNIMFYPECGIPMYISEDINATSIKMICDGVQNKDLFMSLKNLLDAREVISSTHPNPGGKDDIITKNDDDKNIITEDCDDKNNGTPEIISKEKKRQSKEIPAAELFHHSIYREMMFVTFKSFGQDDIDLTAFDREYRQAFDKLPAKYQSLFFDCPSNAVTVLCRKKISRAQDLIILTIIPSKTKTKQIIK